MVHCKACADISDLLAFGHDCARIMIFFGNCEFQGRIKGVRCDSALLGRLQTGIHGTLVDMRTQLAKLSGVLIRAPACGFGPYGTHMKSYSKGHKEMVYCLICNGFPNDFCEGLL